MGTRRVLTSFGLGLGLMYYLDPKLGRRRRALLSEKFSGTLSQFNDTLDVALSDTGNRLGGLVSRGLSRLPIVRAMENRLGEHDRTSLGAAARLWESNWPPAIRLAAGSVGAWLMGRCAARATPVNVLLGTLGFGLFAKAVANPSDKTAFHSQGETVESEEPVGVS